MKINKKILAASLTALVTSSVMISDVEASPIKVTETYNKEDEEFVKVKTVIAKENTEFREYPIDGKIMGNVPKGRELYLIDKLDNGWYYVAYNGTLGCVKEEYFEESYRYEVNDTLKKVVYAVNDTILEVPEAISEGEEYIEVSKLESMEVYKEYLNTYLVSIDNKVGYVNKEAVEELTGTYVIVDISDQMLSLYENNELVIETPVVTGKPSTPSDEGLFEIKEISKNRYLTGPGYKSYVEVFMPYNGGEGLHDASWREKTEFGGDTYLTNGSHGCINMIPEIAEYVSKKVEKGTKVLVKK